AGVAEQDGFHVLAQLDALQRLLVIHHVVDAGDIDCPIGARDRRVGLGNLAVVDRPGRRVAGRATGHVAFEVRVGRVHARERLVRPFVQNGLRLGARNRVAERRVLGVDPVDRVYEVFALGRGAVGRYGVGYHRHWWDFL